MQIYFFVNSVWWRQNNTRQSILQSVSTAYKIITQLTVLFRRSTGGGDPKRAEYHDTCKAARDSELFLAEHMNSL